MHTKPWPAASRPRSRNPTTPAGTPDTEIGGEEIKVRLRLRNVNLNFAIHKWSGTIALAP